MQLHIKVQLELFASLVGILKWKGCFHPVFAVNMIATF